MTVSDFVNGKNMCIFRRYRAGEFYYEVPRINTLDIYEFPIPKGEVDQLGSATLLDEEKAMSLMRWIRKAIEDKTMIKVSNGEEMAKTPIEVKAD